jgi:uncharacterized protein (TIGR02246 family)
MPLPFDEIKAMFDGFAAAWKTNDAAAVAGFFTDDGSLVNPFGERADGRAAVEAMYAKNFQGLLRGSSTTIALSGVRVVETQHALADGDQIVYGSDGGVLFPLHCAVLLRRESGGWRIVDARPYVVATRPA